MRYEEIKHLFPELWYVAANNELEATILNEWRLELWPNCSHKGYGGTYPSALLNLHINDKSNLYIGDIGKSTYYSEYTNMSFHEFMQIVSNFKLSRMNVDSFINGGGGALPSPPKLAASNRPDFNNEEETIKWLRANYPIGTLVISAVDDSIQEKITGQFEKIGINSYFASVQKGGTITIIYQGELTDTKPLCDMPSIIKPVNPFVSNIKYPNLSNVIETIVWLEENYPKGVEFKSPQTGRSFISTGKFKPAIRPNSYKRADEKTGGYVIFEGKFTPTEPKPAIITKSMEALPLMDFSSNHYLDAMDTIRNVIRVSDRDVPNTIQPQSAHNTPNRFVDYPSVISPPNDKPIITNGPITGFCYKYAYSNNVYGCYRGIHDELPVYEVLSNKGEGTILNGLDCIPVYTNKYWSFPYINTHFDLTKKFTVKEVISILSKEIEDSLEPIYPDKPQSIKSTLHKRSKSKTLGVTLTPIHSITNKLKTKKS